MALNKEQLLTLDDSEYVTVETPEWGGSVMLRRMGALAYQHIRSLAKNTDFSDPEQSCELGLTYLSQCIVDPETKELVFDGAADMQRLGRRQPAVIDRLFAAALELHAATPEAAEELEKNSERTANGDGGSVSPGIVDIPIQIS